MIRHLIELSAQGIEALAVAIIVVAIAHGTIRYLFHLNMQVGGAYEQYKVQLGKALLLGLEFLVAADIVRTVALEPTLHNVMILGLLVIVRTFLSWSLVVWRSKGAGRGTRKWRRTAVPRWSRLAIGGPRHERQANGDYAHGKRHCGEGNIPA